MPEPKMKIAVVGAGALGGLYAGYLARSGEEVYGIDIQEKVVSAIRSFGIRMGEPGKQEVSVPLRAFRNPDEVGPVDLVMFMTKSGQTREAARSALRLFGEGTVGLTLQNGLGNPEAIESIVGEKRVLAGVTMNGSTLLGPGRILHAGRGDTIIGEMRGGLSSRVEKVAAAFNQAGLSARGSAEIWNEVWGKLLVNVGVNALTAITRLRNGLVLEHPEARGILRGAVEEAERVAKAKGIRLPYENAVQKTENGCRATAENFSSMLQDVLYQRETEVDFINGAVVREGEKLGIDTPVNRTLTALVKTIEKTYAVRA